MEDYLDIIEIRGRSENGVTQPFICIAEDNFTYYVKGRGAGRCSCRNEWIAGNLALGLNLPIPEFKILNVPEELIQYSAIDDISDLGKGLVFASKKASTDVLDFNCAKDFENSEEIKKSILLFDWWIHNDDRRFADEKGNMNLLWDVPESKLVIIDHNNAFDDQFSADEFWCKHVFRQDPVLAFSPDFVESVTDKMDCSFDSLDKYFSQIPEEWFFEEEEKIYREKVFAILSLYKNERQKFWSGKI